jgi:hypothetical protein
MKYAKIKGDNFLNKKLKSINESIIINKVSIIFFKNTINEFK